MAGGGIAYFAEGAPCCPKVVGDIADGGLLLPGKSPGGVQSAAAGAVAVVVVFHCFVSVVVVV